MILRDSMKEELSISGFHLYLLSYYEILKVINHPQPEFKKRLTYVYENLIHSRW